MNALTGQLSDGVLANLLQFLLLNQASGCLSLRHPQGLQGQVYLEQGRVTHIDSSALSDIAALSVLLTWEQGRFAFRSGVASPKDTLTLSTEGLLLEASYRADVVKSSDGGMISPDSVWQCAPLGGHQSTVAVSLRAIHLLGYIDGEATLHELANRLDVPLDRILDVARELYRHQLIERVSAPMVGREFLFALNRAAVDIMGPMGEIVIEDALFELGLVKEAVPEQALPEFIEELINQFRDRELRRRFQKQVEALRTRYGLAF